MSIAGITICCALTHLTSISPLLLSWRRCGGGMTRRGGGGSARSRGCWRRCARCRWAAAFCVDFWQRIGAFLVQQRRVCPCRLRGAGAAAMQCVTPASCMHFAWHAPHGRMPFHVCCLANPSISSPRRRRRQRRGPLCARLRKRQRPWLPSPLCMPMRMRILELQPPWPSMKLMLAAQAQRQQRLQ